MTGIDARIVKRLPAVKDTAAFELNVHLQAESGITVIIGSSGSGKTLILNSIGGFVRPDEGRILVEDQLYFDGATEVHLSPRHRRCGYIFQDHALFPHMTVRQNLRFAAASGTGRLNLRRRIGELLETFELSELAERRPAQLSGGQKQRAALARILITQPRVLLLDEPSRGLDAFLRQSFYELLRSLHARLRVPTLFVSHDIEECFELADSIVVLGGGKILQSGLREEVCAKPATVEVARLLGIYNIVQAEILGLNPEKNSSRIRAYGQEIEGPYFPGHLIGDSGFLCVRRSHMGLDGGKDVTQKSRLTLRAEAWRPSPHGARVELEGGSSIVVAEAQRANPGDCVNVYIPPTAMAFLEK